jgi:short subunit dehydrogenase-like uncharacterized protein
MAENLHKGGLIRKDGRLTPVPAGWKVRPIDFGRGPKPAMSIPWGDVSTAYHSTQIPNIEVYMAAPAALRFVAAASRYLGPVLGSGPVQALLKRLIRMQPEGPTEEQRRDGFSLLWGEVRDGAGQVRTSRMRTPEGYTLTALASLAIVERVLKGEAPAGFQTPSLAYGADFVLGLEGVERTDLE